MQMRRWNVFLIEFYGNWQNVSYKSYGRDSGNGSSEQDDSPRQQQQQQLVNLHRAAVQQQMGLGSMGRRGTNYPHPPNPALAEGAAMDAQLIAQFRENRSGTSPLRMNQLRGSKRSRSASPWNHTYMEIDLRRRADQLPEGMELTDPVYEEIERNSGECPCRHYTQNSSDMGSDEEGRRQNSDVSRQSSRSYGDNRPLIPLSQHQAAQHADLLTTISCAFNSPHLPRSKHRPHPHPHPHDLSAYPPIHMGFDAAPTFDADRYAERSAPFDDNHQVVFVSNGTPLRAPPSAAIPFTEC